MSRKLPYPGHTWSLSQHAVGLNANTLYDFLKCVAPFEGKVSNYDEKITALMIESGVLTANKRGGQPDAWRDYQQILAELGLIYSTKLVRALTLTELGHMFLAGELGFAELIGCQAIRYQYPNGQKSTIQGRLRGEFNSNSIAAPTTLTEFQADQGILLKPGALILRILLELLNSGHQSTISASECQAFLLPCKTNQEWSLALAELLAHRANPSDIDHINKHARRNIQDWFKFLNKSDFFESTGANYISLSSYALSEIPLMRAYCDSQENFAAFWIPVNFDIDGRRRWSDWFGHLPYEMQTVLRPDVVNGGDYLLKNYVGGIDDDEVDPNVTTGINLTPINFSQLGSETKFRFSDDIAALAEGMRRGAQKRHAKSLLHDRMIKELAQNFIAQGARVESDPNSIDLFAAWPNGESAIFEVKTVTRRSLQGRLRSAIGQVEEYAYRYSTNLQKPDRVVVINTELTEECWQTNFLTKYLGLGLICKSSQEYKGFAPESANSQQYWAW